MYTQTQCNEGARYVNFVLCGNITFDYRNSLDAIGLWNAKKNIFLTDRNWKLIEMDFRNNRNNLEYASKKA